MSTFKWTVLTYESPRGEKPIDAFITSQQKQAKGKIIRLIDLLEKHGPMLGMPHSKQLNTNLFELRIRGRQELRIFYCFRNHKITLLHGFKKQTQKTPQKEITTALGRMDSLT